MSTVSPLPIPPVEKSIVVACTPARAFQAFTAEIAAWWPLHSHSVGDEKTIGLCIEPQVGGRIYETIEGGQQHDWGRILTWSPPAEFSMTWHPGHPPEVQQRVTITFVAEGNGTRVRLVHDNWAARPDGRQARETYNSGWEKVFVGAFGQYLGRAP